MSDYISREAVLAKSKNMYPSIDHYCVSEHVVTCKDIYNIPAADVALVVHGEWIDYAEGGKQCTACKGVFWYGEYNPIEPNFCPNCGAKMGR